MVNELDYVELGLSCADIYRPLDRGISQSGRHGVSRFLHARDGKDTTAP